MNYLLIFIIVLSSTLLLVRIARRVDLLAYPGEHRLHTEPTPLVGGIGIALGLGAMYLLQADVLPALLPAIVLIVLTGVLDDRFKLPSWSRFLAQAIALWLMVRTTGVELHSLGGVWPQRNVDLGEWSLAMTIFAGIGVINAFNMSDGMDGLAGCLAALALLVIIALAPANDVLAVTSLVALSAFLLLNLRIARQRALVFLGDAGSMLIGLLLCFLLIKYSQGEAAVFAPVTALWIVALPLFDAVGVLLIRPLRGGSPFSADRAHYHHLLLRRGLSVNQALSLLCIAQSALILAGLAMARLGVAEWLQLLAFLLLFSFYLVYLWGETQ